MTTGESDRVFSPTGALLVGSVPLADSEEVFRSAVSVLGEHLRRLPDGETGDRLNWIVWQLLVFQDCAQMEVIPEEREYVASWPRVRPKQGVPAADLHFGPLGYAKAARESYTVFRALKDEGVVPPEMRFQVSLPTPLAPLVVFVRPEAQAEVEPAYEAAMLAEVAEIVAAVPAAELAIQWDVCWEIALLEGFAPPYFEGDVLTNCAERVARLSAAVPDGVELGYHLCYGDYKHSHFTQPKDTGLAASLFAGIRERVSRPIAWLHVPVPADRADREYFAPLADLDLPPETELFLGLLHHRDGVDGARRRIEAAREVVGEFGVATECGFGRRPPHTVSELLELHRQVSAPVLGRTAAPAGH